MTKKEKKEICCWEDVRKLPQAEQMKYEVAEELGLIDQVFSEGWGSLTSKESGKIGGILHNQNQKGTK